MRPCSRPSPLRLLAAALLAALVVSGCTGSDAPAEPPVAAPEPSGPFGVERIVLASPTNERVPLTVWVADAPEKRALGLMHRTHLPDGAGMLFVFDADTDGPFWMKNTRIPLSIAFFSDEGELLRVLDMQPCGADPCPLYEPGVRYRWALEVPHGWFVRSRVVPGWRISRHAAT